ncbi:hypothetical protein Pint_29894 [Pistacia integerrima]|uniref:Uncharacterized protein n=1 Tax=Pistacia integerrima TaxID=434235 RepID=A0ACC0WZH7_9ROSI|nr:hypothetical protein Pint_29894 [Pistacia integerrima]
MTTLTLCAYTTSPGSLKMVGSSYISPLLKLPGFLLEARER